MLHKQYVYVTVDLNIQIECGMSGDFIETKVLAMSSVKISIILFRLLWTKVNKQLKEHLYR